MNVAPRPKLPARQMNPMRLRGSTVESTTGATKYQGKIHGTTTRMKVIISATAAAIRWVQARRRTATATAATATAKQAIIAHCGIQFRVGSPNTCDPRSAIAWTPPGPPSPDTNGA